MSEIIAREIFVKISEKYLKYILFRIIFMSRSTKKHKKFRFWIEKNIDFGELVRNKTVAPGKNSKK